MIFEISQSYTAILFSAGSLVLVINFVFVLKNFPSMHAAIKLFFHFAVVIFLIGVIFSTFIFSTGMYISGIGMILLAYWLLSYDLAKKSIKNQGLPKFIAIGLMRHRRNSSTTFW